MAITRVFDILPQLQEKFNITSIAPELEKLRKSNPNFCFLIAEKDKIDDI